MDPADTCIVLADIRVPELIMLRRIVDGLDRGGDEEPSKGSEAEESGGDSSSESDVEGTDDRTVPGMACRASITLSSTVALSGCSRKGLVELSGCIFDFVRSRNMRYGREVRMSVSSRTRSSCCGDFSVLVSVMDMTTNRLRTAL